jgi:formylglycine-generating enzyme required for sulfatase activity
MNVFQGVFPTTDTGADGYRETSPVGAYPPDGFGLHNMTGNTWEWCAEWFSPTTYAARNAPVVDPAGPLSGHHQGDPRRLLPLAPVLLPPLPGVGP